MIISTPEEFKSIVLKLTSKPFVAFDTETTGLRVWHRDELFSVIFHDGEEGYYFNFKDYKDDSPYFDKSLIKLLQPIFNSGIRFAHNAKFDMHFLAKGGLEFPCDILDTEVLARITYNQHLSYSLDSCAERELNEKKDDKVMKYITDNNLWEWEKKPGKSQTSKILFFDKVPFEIISVYALKDAELTYKLGMKFLEEIKSKENGKGKKPSDHLLIERDVTKVCYKMEKTGILIDEEYCTKGVDYETKRYLEAEEEFKKLTGLEFVDSGQSLQPILESLGFKVNFTEKGTPDVSDYFLKTVKHPISDIIRKHRDAYKRANTYFRNFIYQKDANGLIHANMRQAGTNTLRFSYQEPNLQNITDDSESGSPFPIRRAFIPRKDHTFIMIDYNQMEFRLMLDYANQFDLIRKILDGHDPHDATAELTGLTRKAAKTLNFGLLYGMGIQKLADAIGVNYDTAKKFKKEYFNALDMVENFIRGCTNVATNRKYVFGYTGMRYHFTEPKFSYRATNSIIQGGCAGIVKKAMASMSSYLEEKNINLLIQIHDELLFEIPNSLDLDSTIKDLKGFMQNAYEYKKMPLTCSASISVKSWADAEERD